MRVNVLAHLGIRKSLVNIVVIASIGSLLFGGLPNFPSQRIASASPKNLRLGAESGQYFPIAPVEILNTQSGLGMSGGTGPVSPNAIVDGVSVLGKGDVPLTGVEAVFVSISEFSASNNGNISMFPSDASNPTRAVVNFHAGQQETGSGYVMLSGASSLVPRSISFGNNGQSFTQFSVEVLGFVSDGSLAVSGDTYAPISPTTVFNQGGLGSSAGLVSPGASVVIPVAAALSAAGVSAVDVDATQLSIGANGIGGSGSIAVGGKISNASAPTMFFMNGDKRRLTTILQPDSTGAITVKNLGTKSVIIQIVLDGYFVSPLAAEAGSTFVPMDTTLICDTHIGCTSNGSIVGTIAANSSITVQEGGVSGIPNVDVSAVSNIIDAANMTATGWLTVGPAGSPANSQIAVNFNNGDSSDASYESVMTSSLSTSGAITITNNSAGTVDVILTSVGYWLGASVPSAPTGVSATFNGSTSSLSWGVPEYDGGASLTGYVVTSSNGGSFSLPATSSYVDIPASSSDYLTVSAVNSMGQGPQSAATPVSGGSDLADAASSAALSASQEVTSTPAPICDGEQSPPPAGTVSGYVYFNGGPSQGGSAASGDTVDIAADLSANGGIYPALASVTSDANGCFFFTPPTNWPTDSSDPTSLIPSEISALGGNLNLEFSASASMTINGVVYPLSGTAETADSISNSVGNPMAIIVNLYPTQAGTPTPAAVSPFSARSQHLHVHGVAHPDTATSRFGEINSRYRTVTSSPWSPYVVNGVNLAHFPKRISVRGLGLSSALRFSANAAVISRNRKLMSTLDVRRRLGSRNGARRQQPHLLITPPPSNSLIYDFYLATGQKEPANSQVANICLMDYQSSSSSFVLVPAAESHMYVQGESGSFTLSASSSFTSTVRVGIDTPLLTIQAGTSAGSGSGISYSSTQQYSSNHAGNFPELMIPRKIDTRDETLKCVQMVVGPDFVDPSILSNPQYFSQYGSPGYGKGLWDVDSTTFNFGYLVAETLDAYASYGVQIPGWKIMHRNASSTTTAVNAWLSRNSSMLASVGISTISDHRPISTLHGADGRAVDVTGYLPDCSRYWDAFASLTRGQCLRNVERNMTSAEIASGCLGNTFCVVWTSPPPVNPTRVSDTCPRLQGATYPVCGDGPRWEKIATCPQYGIEDFGAAPSSGGTFSFSRYSSHGVYVSGNVPLGTSWIGVDLEYSWTADQSSTESITMPSENPSGYWYFSGVPYAKGKGALNPLSLPSSGSIQSGIIYSGVNNTATGFGVPC